MARLLRLFVLFLAMALGLCAVGAGAQTVVERLVTPGDLAHGHAKLEGHCETCHAAFDKSAQNGQCLSCHKGIARDIATHRRWHGKVAEARPQPCKACHVEHKGREHPLAPFDKAHFDHRNSDYPLTGGHAKVACIACHTGTGPHYRETPRDCASCHAARDPHRGRLGSACASCHTLRNWREQLPFDHGRTGYALTGAHATTPCVACHRNEQWKSTPTACASCHAAKDVHRGTDGPRCGTCHTTGNWRQVAFDHDRIADFPLRGGHSATACVACHAHGNMKPPAPLGCVGCHRKDDVHKGSDGSDCAHCHTDSTWKVASFSHDRTAFPLVGAHVRLACVACHVQSVDTVKVGTHCIDCHKRDDVHHGGFGTVCEGCHNQQTFHVVRQTSKMGPGMQLAPSSIHRQRP